MLYASETWGVKVEDMSKLERMQSAMCGVTLKDRKSTEELQNRLGIEGIADVMRRGRLRWLGTLNGKMRTGYQNVEFGDRWPERQG